MHREYHRWFSTFLQRDMELLVFGHEGEIVLVFPTRAGRFYDYEDWCLIQPWTEAITAGKFQLCCVDSVDGEGLYRQDIPPSDRIRRHQEYEDYILHEVLPFLATCNAGSRITLHGCSMGAYHAVNLALRHPQHFQRVVALSGRYDLTISTANFRDLFDGHYDEAIYFHTPSHFLPNLEDEPLLQQIRALDIVLAIGEQDQFLENNCRFSASLWDKGIWHALDIWAGEAHKPRHWREMITRYFAL